MAFVTGTRLVNILHCTTWHDLVSKTCRTYVFGAKLIRPNMNCSVRPTTYLILDYILVNPMVSSAIRLVTQNFHTSIKRLLLLSY
jgi:hypothetical protein